MNLLSREHTNTLHKIKAHIGLQSQSEACTFVANNCRFVLSFSFNVLLAFNAVSKLAHMFQTWKEEIFC